MAILVLSQFMTQSLWTTEGPVHYIPKGVLIFRKLFLNKTVWVCVLSVQYWNKCAYCEAVTFSMIQTSKARVTTIILYVIVNNQPLCLVTVQLRVLSLLNSGRPNRIASPSHAAEGASAHSSYTLLYCTTSYCTVNYWGLTLYLVGKKFTYLFISRSLFILCWNNK